MASPLEEDFSTAKARDYLEAEAMAFALMHLSGNLYRPRS